MDDCCDTPKVCGLSLTYENLPKTDQFWTVVNEEIEKLTLDPIDITSREMVFDHYYITQKDLVFTLPKWKVEDAGVQTVKVPWNFLT